MADVVVIGAGPNGLVAAIERAGEARALGDLLTQLRASGETAPLPIRDDPAIHEGQCTKDLCVDYVAKSPGLSDLAVMDRKTGKMSSVSVGSGDHRVPVITPDGKRIVFIYNPAGYDSSYSLMVVGVDGSDPKVLVAGENPSQTIWLPAISPDGKLVAYSKGNYPREGVDGTKSDIFVICLP